MANERLMQLFNMFVGQMNQIGQQRQQRSRDRAGMEMEGAKFKFAKEQATEQMKGNIADRKMRLDMFNLTLKESEARQKGIDLGVEQQAKEAEFAMASEPSTRKETGEEFTGRGAAGVTAGVGGDVGFLSSAMALVKNLGKTYDLAAKGPQDVNVPGMTRSEFMQQEIAEGASYESLATLPATEKTDYVRMKAAFDMSIMYGVDLPAEFSAMPGVVKAIDKGKTAWAKAQTDSDKKIALDIAMAEANLEYAQWRAKHPGGIRSSGLGGPNTIEEEPVEPMTDDAARSQMSQFTEPPPEGWTDTGILARVTQLEQLEAAYETEGNNNLMIYARNIKRQLQDILQGLVKKPRAPLSEQEYQRPPSGAGGRAY